MQASTRSGDKRFAAAFLAGTLVGIIGGLIGRGGAEFRLPMLIGLFGFAALTAVILNKAMSLAVVASTLLFQAEAVPLEEVVAHWPIIANFGAWLGADWVTRLANRIAAVGGPASVVPSFVVLLAETGRRLYASESSQTRSRPAVSPNGLNRGRRQDAALHGI